MGRPKKRPSELTDEMMGDNPFMANVSIPVYKISKKVVDDGSVNLETATLEVTAFTKVFEITGYKQRMSELSARGKEMLLWLIHYVPAAKDYMWINREEYMKMNGIKSSHTFLRALEELSLLNYVQLHGFIKDVIWINPLFFYKGSRIKKFPDKLSIKRRKQHDEPAEELDND